MTDPDDLQTSLEQQQAAAGRQAIPTTVVPPTPAASTTRPDTTMPAPPAWEAAPDAEPFSLAQPVKVTKGDSSLWGTVGASAWEATMNMGSDALAAASFAARQATQDPAIVGYIENARKGLDQHIQNYVESQPADRQMAMHASIFGGTDPNGQHIPTPGEVGYKNYVASTLGSLVPDIALAVLPEAVVGRLAIKLGMEGIGKAVAGAAATGTAFGVDQAGGAYKALVDTVDHTSDKEMMENPTYAHLRQDQGLDETQAKSKLVGSDQVRNLILGQFAVGAVTGAGTGQLITHGALGAAEKGLLARTGIGAAEGSATMGVQGAAGDYLQQQANMAAGPQLTYDPTQTAHALASGMLGGALMGAAGGAIHGKAPDAEPVKVPEGMAEDTHGALREALQLTYDAKTDVQPGQSPPNPVNVSNAAARVDPMAGQPDVANALRPTPGATSEATAPVNNPVLAEKGDIVPKSADAVSSPVAPDQAAALTPTQAPAPQVNSSAGALLADHPNMQTEQFKPSSAYDPATKTFSPIVDAKATDVTPPTAKPTVGDQLKAKQQAKLAKPVDAAPAVAAAKPAEAMPAAKEVDPVQASKDAEAAWVKQAVEGGAAWKTKRQAIIKDAQAQGVPMDQMMTLVSQMEANSRASHPEFHMSADQVGKVARHLETLDDVKPADVLKAEKASRDGELAYDHGARVKKKPMDADLEDKLAESGGKLDADEARTEMTNEKEAATADRETETDATTVADEEQPESSAGMVQDYGAEKTRTTTNLNRTLADLEHKIVEGHVSPAEADTMFGKHGGKTAPENRTVKAWLEHQISRRDDTPTARNAVLDMAEKVEAGRKAKLAPKEQKKLEAKLKIEIAKFDPDYIQRLRDARDELDSQVEPPRREYATFLTKPGEIEANKLAVDAMNGDITKQAAAAGLDELLKTGAIQEGVHTINTERLKHARSREITPAIQYQRNVNNPELNAKVTSMLRSGDPHTLHDYLDAIMSDKDLQKSAAPMVALARRLKMIAPDIGVMSHEQAADKFGMEYYRPQDAGSYHPPMDNGTKAVISMHTGDIGSKVETVLHEATHAVTSGYIENLPKGHPDRLALNAMHEELSTLLDRPTLSDRERGELEYALSDEHELHTMLLTNPTVQRLAANHIPGPEFVRKMNGLGYVGQAARAVWSYFTSFVRRALGMTDAGSMPMLDHILRPLQDITDRAAKFNADNSVHGIQESAVHAMPDFSKLKDVAADKIDPAGIPDKLRKFLLPGATSDGIVKWNAPLFDHEGTNALKDWRKSVESTAHRIAEHHTQFADQVKELINGVQGKERDKIASLLVDATTADVKIGRNLATDANDHLRDLTEQKALQTRFNALSDKGKASYEAVRDYHKQVYQIERDAQLRSMVKAAIPDATPEQTKRIAEAARTKAGIERLIAGSDTDPVAQAFGTAWNGRRAIVQGIGKVHRSGFVQGDYFPLRRSGDYVIRYGEHGDSDYGVEMFDSASKAQARRDELNKQGVRGLSPVMEKRSSKMKDAMSTTVVDEMAATMKQNPDLAVHADAMRDLVSTIQLQHATRSEQARSRMRRQGVKGASTDVEKVMAQDFLSTATRLGYLEHGVDTGNALNAMQRRVDFLGRTTEGSEQRRAMQVLHEVQQRTAAGDDASSGLSNIARKFSALGFVQSLMSPSHMITSTIEAHMNSTALLGARHGPIQSGIALARALKDISPSMAAVGAKNTLKAIGKGLQANDWNLSHVVRDKLIANGENKSHMNALFKGMNDAGLIDHSMVREMQRIANPGSDITRGWWQRFMDMNSAGAHAVDVANKSAIGKAAFDLEMRKTGDAAKATEYAIETIRQATPNYNLGNKARIATDKGALGGFAAPLFQFKNYGLHMYSMMANLTKASIHGATPGERMEARKAFAGILATHAIMAGSLTLIGDPLRWVGGAYDFATGAAGPHDYENDVRRWAAAAFGKEAGELLTRGAPQALGIDLHRRIGLSNLLEPPELNSFDKKGFTEAVASALTGASGQDAITMADGLTKLIHGDVMGGLQSIVPRVLRDPIKAYKLGTQGVTDTKGKTILPAKKISTGAVAAQAVGFQPSEVSEFREGRAAVQERMKEASGEKQKIMTGLLSGGGDKSDLLTRIRDYNHANPGQAITYSQIIQAQVKARKAAMTPQPTGSFGLKMPKKGGAQLGAAGDFAND